MWNLSTHDCEYNKAWKIEHLDINNCSCEKHLFCKLVLTRKDEILNLTETSLDDIKVTCEKKKKELPYSHNFIGNYMLVVITCLFY